MSALTQITDFRGIHQGKRLFILSSGPSLGTHDLSRLQRRMVMGLNRSFLVYPHGYYHCCMDQRLFDAYPELLASTRYLFTLQGRPLGVPIKLLGSEGFSYDLSQGIYSGYTISYLALQVAVWMGFTEVIYLGLDLKHQGHNTHFFGHDFHSRNHENTEFPRMRKMLNYGALELAKSMPHIKIYNCSPDSDLECFERISFEQALAL